VSSPWVTPAEIDTIRRRHPHIEQDTLDIDHDEPEEPDHDD
jgi:hypothetical protein